MSKDDLKVKPVEQEVTIEDLRKVHGGVSKDIEDEARCPMDCQCKSPKSYCSSKS